MVFSKSGEAKNGPLRSICSRRFPSPTGSLPRGSRGRSVTWKYLGGAFGLLHRILPKE